MITSAGNNNSLSPPISMQRNDLKTMQHLPNDKNQPAIWQLLKTTSC